MEDMRRLNQGWLSSAVCYIFLFFTLLDPLIVLAQEQPDCKAKFEEARKKFYNESAYRAVVDLLESCAGRRLLGEVVDEVAAYEWLGQSYLQLGDTLRARKAGEQILTLWPKYSPDHPFGTKPAPESGPVELLPGFRNLMIRIIAEKENRPGWWKRNWKYVAGGGAVVAGGIIYVLSGDGNGNTTTDTGFPNPPGRP